MSFTLTTSHMNKTCYTHINILPCYIDRKTNRTRKREEGREEKGEGEEGREEKGEREEGREEKGEREVDVTGILWPPEVYQVYSMQIRSGRTGCVVAYVRKWVWQCIICLLLFFTLTFTTTCRKTRRLPYICCMQT